MNLCGFIIILKKLFLEDPLMTAKRQNKQGNIYLAIIWIMLSKIISNLGQCQTVKEICYLSWISA
jgi:hypothetical protein